jgi:hypothetical protein
MTFSDQVKVEIYSLDSSRIILTRFDTLRPSTVDKTNQNYPKYKPQKKGCEGSSTLAVPGWQEDGKSEISKGKPIHSSAADSVQMLPSKRQRSE